MVQGFVLAAFITLTLLVSRRRSKVAKWILIALAIVGLPFAVLHYAKGLYLGAPLIGLIQTVMQLIAYGLLFTDQSRRWFRREGVEPLARVFE